ncbi:MFS transporter [Lophium mytilinum]|uniref:MFS transporter n=1 Tax=Lophium mytilinum TaxID=390894 RepID=A0A6A6QVI9_9PEZI|nr:MFS transporter [Lophium mytilinum]
MLTTDSNKATEIRQAAAKHHGLPLLPRPTDDERDPLRWPRSLKLAALIATAFVNFTANFAGAGLSVASPVLQAQFHKTPNQVNSLLTFNFLLLGVGNLFWVPLGVKFGKRASLLISTLILFAVLVWTAKETAFAGLLAARCLSGFASAAGESIVPSIVTDIFFLHEHAAMMSWYTILVSSATAIGPLVASFIVQYSRGGWVDYVWVCAALAGANTVAIYFLYPESNFNRPKEPLHRVSVTGEDADKVQVVKTETISRHRVSVVSKSWFSIWTSVFTINREINILEVALRPLKMLLRPSVLLATFIYGTSLASQIILIFAFPSLLLAPPYLFSSSQVGLMQIAAIIGFSIGCFAGGYIADIITAVVIRRQTGNVYPEQRLVALIPGCLVAPAGCILIAFACSDKLHWVAIAFGFGMVSFGTIYAPNIAITYVVECYPRVVAECLVAINVFKNLVAFLFLYTAVDWVASSGWTQVYMIMFMLVSLSMLLAIPFYFFGPKWRGQVDISNVSEE